MLKLAAFLGNPGQEYSKTRHNFPWILLDSFNYIESSCWVKKFKADYQKITAGSNPVHIIKPLTYMNKSGESISTAASFFKIAPEEILVVYDDIELEFGTVELKKSGGLKGHNGLKSINSHIGNNFMRLRMGISQPRKGDVSSHVLGRFTEEEEIILPVLLDKTASLLKDILTDSSAVKSNLDKKNLFI